MKKIAALIFAFFACYSGITANESDPNSELITELRNEVAQLLENPEFSVSQEEVKANIAFRLNAKNEIEVLDVVAEQDKVIDFVKNRLNRHQVDLSIQARKNKIFKITLKILQP